MLGSKPGTPVIDQDLEREADVLLAAAPRNADAPCYSDRQLRRRDHAVAGLADVVDLCGGPPRNVRDELLFLIEVAHMRSQERLCLRLWVDGWTQAEMAAALVVPQQRVSRWFRAGVIACRDTAPPSFTEFSRHSIYRAPRACWARQPQRPVRRKVAEPEPAAVRAEAA